MAYGVTSAMIETYGDMVFDLSLNRQTRLGDPVRALDMAAIAEQRRGTGLTDADIATRLGLTAEQARFIRVVVERRRFRADQYRKLFTLGTGRRWREARYTDPATAQGFSGDAMRLRGAMRHDGGAARKFIERGWWRDDTLSGWLDKHAEAAPDRPAILAGGGTVTYGALRDRVGRLAGALMELGIRRGDVVAVRLPNSTEFVVGYLAIASLGGVMTTLHMSCRGAEIAAQLAHSRARAVICANAPEGFRAGETIVARRASLPALEHIICLGEPCQDTVALDDLIANGRAIAAGAVPVASDPFLLLYTSGTTDRPKAVPLAYHGILANARLSSGDFAINANDILLSAAPFSHLFGLYSLHLAFHAGATSLLLPSFKPDELAGLIDAGRASVLLAAPAHIAACLAADHFAADELSSLRLAIVSGSTLGPDLAGDLDRVMEGGTVAQLWGMTEIQAGLYTRPGDGVAAAARSAGRASPGNEVRIVGAEGSALGPGHEGELETRGCSLFSGYLDDDEEGDRAFSADGWFRSGDLAIMDEAGNVAITGRIKDIINRGGVKFNPREIEALLDRHDKIERSAIVAMPDPILGERACCFAVMTTGDRVSLDDIRAYLRDHEIAPNKLPERLEIVTAMAMTPTGKVIKKRLAPEGGW